MTVALVLLAVQGLIGAFDTFYFHEWRARLPALGAQSAPELRLHACRSFLYALIFGTLPWLAWQGAWVWSLTAILVAEIVFTLWDFIVEIAVRKPLGDVYGGERVTHAIMGIVYGGMLAFLTPVMAEWLSRPTALTARPLGSLSPLDWLLMLMALGVFLSGARPLRGGGAAGRRLAVALATGNGIAESAPTRGDPRARSPRDKGCRARRPV